MTSRTDDREFRSFDYAADVESIAMARNDAAGFVMESLKVDESSGEPVHLLVDQLRLVVSELCSNAIDAAPGRWFRVEIAVDDGEPSNGQPGRPYGVSCSVTNPADDDRKNLRFGVAPDLLAERGRGLMIVERLADRTWAEQTPDATIVTAELSVAASH